MNFKDKYQEYKDLFEENLNKFLDTLDGEKDIPNPFRGDLAKYKKVFNSIRIAVEIFVNE